MDTKGPLNVMDAEIITKVQRWVSLDNKIEIKKSKLKEYTDEKRHLEEDIVRYVDENRKTNLQINTSDGHIDFNETKTQQSMTIKYIRDTIHRYFDEGPDAAADPDAIIDFLLEQRETKSKTVMRRHITYGDKTSDKTSAKQPPH